METVKWRVKVAKLDSEKDIGVIFDSNMKFGEHINTKVTKANQILGLIFRTIPQGDVSQFVQISE